MIDVFVPVLGRPDNVQSLLESLHANSEIPHRVLFMCSPGDEAQIEVCMRSGEDVRVVSWDPAHADYPKKMNAAFRETSNPWMLLGADDISFEKGWDTEALHVAERTSAAVVGTNDVAHPDVRRGLTSTHPLVSRRYVTEYGGSLDGPGVLIHEGYDHNYCERELVGLAQSRQMWAFARKSIVRHRHPCWGTAPIDDTYRKPQASIGLDHQLFLTRSNLWGGVGLTRRELASAPRFRRRAMRTR